MVDGTVHEVLRSDMLGWVVFGVFVITIMLIKSVTSLIKSLARERTRREIAAYVAEGSMSPEQGEKLMNAGPVEMDDEDLRRRIADHVAAGSMSPDDGERLIRAGRSPKAG